VDDEELNSERLAHGLPSDSLLDLPVSMATANLDVDTRKLRIVSGGLPGPNGFPGSPCR
jgi:hypothetical protein